MDEEQNNDVTDTSKRGDSDSSSKTESAQWLLPLVLAVFTLIICSAIAAIVILKNRQIPEIITAQLETVNNETQVEPLLECFHSMPIPFGGKAQSQCFLECFGPKNEKDTCNEYCDQFLAENYARRLLAEDADKPDLLADKISEDCFKLDSVQRASESLSSELWSDIQTSAITYITRADIDIEVYETEELVQRFLRAEVFHKKLLLPKEDSEEKTNLTKKTRRILCLLQSLATTQLAVLDASDRKDVLSEKFYRDLESNLIQHTRIQNKELQQIREEKLALDIGPPSLTNEELGTN